MNLVLNILNGSGKWQIFYNKKRKYSHNELTYLDIACENNNIQLISLLIKNQTFMKFYENFPNKKNIFFIRLNRIAPSFYEYDKNSKINNELREDSWHVTLNSKIFPEEKETFDGFSQQISLLLQHFGGKIDEKFHKDNQNILEIHKHLEFENCFYLMEFRNEVTNMVLKNRNFILRAFMHLNIETVLKNIIFIIMWTILIFFLFLVFFIKIFD